MSSWSRRAVLIVVTTLVACSGRDTDTSTGTTEAAVPTTTAAVTTTPVTSTRSSVSTTREDVVVGGTSRSYLLSVPSPLPEGQLALVVAFHGGFGSGDQLRATTGLDQEAARRGFIVAFPDGTTDPGSGAIPAIARTWNAGDCCGPAARLGIDDVAFFDALVADVAGRYAIDPDRILVTGHSNGAMMAFRLACERADHVAAIAPVAGSLELAPCRPSRPVSVLAIHGDSDQNHPIGGGRGSRALNPLPYRPLREGMDLLAVAAGCGSPPSETVLGPETRLVWPSCTDETAVEMRIVAGADHPWPGSDPNPAASAVQGQPSQAIDATTEVLDFLLAHGRV